MQPNKIIWLLVVFILALMGRAAPTAGLAKIALPRSDPVSFNTGIRAIKKDPNGLLRADTDGILRSFAADGALVDSYHLGEFWVPPSESSYHSSTPDKILRLGARLNKAWFPASELGDRSSSLDNINESWAPSLELGSHSTPDQTTKLSKPFYKPIIPPSESDGQISTPENSAQLNARASWLTPSQLGNYASKPSDEETEYNHLDKSWFSPSEPGDYSSKPGEDRNTNAYFHEDWAPPSKPRERSSTTKEDSKLAISTSIKPAQLDIDGEILGECSPPVYCVDSSTCGGGCGSCTYIGWFPYGLCLVG